MNEPSHRYWAGILHLYLSRCAHAVARSLFGDRTLERGVGEMSMCKNRGADVPRIRNRIGQGIKIWLIVAFLSCTGHLYAYANFRAVKGELFFRAIITEPGLLYARTHDTRFHNTWGMDAWEELIRRVDGAPQDVSARTIFWWGAHADAVPDVPDRPERLVAVVTRGRTTLRIFIYEYPQQSEEDFNRDYPGLVDGIVRRFADQGVLTWKESTTAQLRWLPFLVRQMAGPLWMDYALVRFQETIGFLIILPSLLPLLFLVLSPSWLALPGFWFCTVLSGLIILYIVLPARLQGWVKAKMVRSRRHS